MINLIDDLQFWCLDIINLVNIIVPKSLHHFLINPTHFNSFEYNSYRGQIDHNLASLG